MYNNMKKIFMAVAVSFFMSANVTAQIDLGSILESVGSTTSESTSNSSGKDIISSLTSIFSSKKQASEENLVGTWVYEEPAIVLSSSNILASAAAKVAENKIEKELATQLGKLGIKEGAMSITLNSDKTFSEKIGSKTLSGTWTVENSKLVMTYSSIKKVSLTTQLSGSELMLVVDASKLISLFRTIGNAASNVNSKVKLLNTLMKNVNGIQAGLTLKKQ